MKHALALAGGMWVGEPPQDAPAAKSTKAQARSVASQLGELKEAMEAQLKQISDLSQRLPSRDQQIQQRGIKEKICTSSRSRRSDQLFDLLKIKRLAESKVGGVWPMKCDIIYVL